MCFLVQEYWCQKRNRLQDRERQEGGSSPSQAFLEQIGRTDYLAVNGGVITVCTLLLFYEKYLWL